MTETWLRAERTELAAERILDAAQRVFAERGVSATEMAHIAEAAGCSRATLYRYFAGKRDLHVTFMHREARRVAREVAERVAAIPDDRQRLVEAIMAAVRDVRDTPALAAWFTRPDGGHTTALASASPVVHTLCAAFFGDPADEDNRARARWVLRVVVSLLADPGGTDAEERVLVERFAVPVLLPPTPQT